MTFVRINNIIIIMHVRMHVLKLPIQDAVRRLENNNG